MGCPPVRGDNPRALFYTTYISVDLAYREIFRAKVGKGAIKRLPLWKELNNSLIAVVKEKEKTNAYWVNDKNCEAGTSYPGLA